MSEAVSTDGLSTDLYEPVDSVEQAVRDLVGGYASAVNWAAQPGDYMYTYTFPDDAGGPGSDDAFRIETPQENTDTGVITVPVTFNGGVHWPDYPYGQYWYEMWTVTFTPLTVSLQTPDAQATENADGEEADPGQFQAVLSGEANGTVTVNLESPGGTATEGEDYESLPRELTFSAGQTIKPIDVNVIDDPDAEDDETIELSLAEGPNYFLGADPATRAAPLPVKIGDNASIKQVTVKGFKAPNIETFNKFNGYKFLARIDVIGERLDLIEVQQEINSSTTVYKSDGTVRTGDDLASIMPANTAKVKYDSGGWAEDAGGAWRAMTPLPNSKNGAVALADFHSLYFAPQAANYGTEQIETAPLFAVTRYLRDNFRKVGAQATVYTFSWGFKWDNYDLAWTAQDPQPRPQGVVSIARSNKDPRKGRFYDIQEISGLDEI
jgi:hypothetical protein